MGKDLSRICLPVFFNEPLSSLQRIAEDMEYSELLDEVGQQPSAGLHVLQRLTECSVSATWGQSCTDSL